MAHRTLTPSELTVLQLLHEGPTHPYDMQRLVRERRIDILVPVRRGTLYHAVERLEKRGLVETVETTREGRRPERTVYRITETGQDALIDRLRELLADPQPDYPPLVQALSFISGLDPADARRQLELRVGALEGRAAALRAQAFGHGLPRVWIVEEEYAVALIEAELAYVRGLVADLAAGRLTWEPSERSAPPDLHLVDPAQDGETA